VKKYYTGSTNITEPAAEKKHSPVKPTSREIYTPVKRTKTLSPAVTPVEPMLVVAKAPVQLKNTRKP